MPVALQLRLFGRLQVADGDASLTPRLRPRAQRLLAYLILHNSAAADDAAQETFTRGLMHIQSYRGEAEPKAWLSSIALNICRHLLRDEHHEAKGADPEKLERGYRVGRPRTRGAVTHAIRKERNRMLSVALGYLTPGQREVFVLHYVNGLPYEQIAQMLSMRPGAARALAHRAKAVLREKLGSDTVVPTQS